MAHAIPFGVYSANILRNLRHITLLINEGLLTMCMLTEGMVTVGTVTKGIVAHAIPFEVYSASVLRQIICISYYFALNYHFGQPLQ